MKQIEKTREILDRLRAAFGEDVDVSDYAVYEAIALNNLPIRQKHPLYEGAVAQDSLLREMVSTIQAESRPLMVMHDTRSALPVGRVFDAKLHGQEVRVLFALSKTTEADHVVKLDQGIVDQVSVNVLPKEILCSECGWDYLGEDASFSNVFEGVCGNGHELGKDGVHCKLHGLDHFGEVSLVHMGGARNARIVGRSQQTFANSESFQRLAASGRAPDLFLACISPEKPKDTTMDLTELVASLSDVKAEKLALTAQLEAVTAEHDETKTQLEAAQAELAELKAKGEPEAPEAVVVLLKDIAKRTAVALGDQNPTVPEKVEELIASITEGQTKLSALIPLGGAAQTAVDDLGDLSLDYAPTAFRTSGR